ncbi:unnamed protein product, partial [Owenia fusiformis]
AIWCGLFRAPSSEQKMDPLIYISAAVLVGILLILVTFLKSSSRKGDDAAEPAEERPARNVRAPANIPAAARARQRVGRRRMNRANQDSDEEEPEDDIFQYVDQPEGKIGAKKMKKLEEKAAKRQAREAEEQEREEKKKREEMLEKKRKKEDERAKAEEAIREEEEKKLKEEQEQRDHEEYLKMKEMFSVEDEGEVGIITEEDQQSLLHEFIEYIKQMKVVMLEDLATHFKLKTQECIDRVNDLLEDGQLSGVMDDRGKFIYITQDELEAVAKFIKQRGRVSIVELAESSNQLINLNPDNMDTMQKLLGETSA